MNQKALLTIILCIMVSIPLCMTATSDESDAFVANDLNGINIISFDDQVRIDAGDSYNLVFTIYNTTDVTKIVSVTDVKISDEKLGSASCKPTVIPPISGKDHSDLTITIKIEKYADAGEHDLHFNVTVCDSNDTSTKTVESFTIPLKVESDYASGDVYNKFFGLIPNTLPSPFNESWFTMIVTFISMCAIGALIGHVIYRIIDRKWSKNGNDSSKDAKSIGKQVTLVMVIAGLSLCLRIFGANEILTGLVTDLITVAFIVIGAYIVWKGYKIVIHNVIVKYDKNDRVDDSLVPLFKMIGRIVICVVALSSVLSIFGFNLATIVTSAGLVSLAISLGAQETLNQFFCGIQLMATRPFRIGDKVKLGTSQDVLIVRKIRVMDTEFKNWLNEEVFRVPNSTVMSSMITNITFDDDSYKIYEYVDVDYGADIDKAKEIMLDVVKAHPQVITDGSKAVPTFRFSSMESSSIRLRVSYVITDHELSYVVPCQIREAIFKRLKAEGIKIPHNIIDIHMEE